MNGSIMVDGNFDADVNDTVLKERELLSQDGFLMILAQHRRQRADHAQQA
ncbi:MAG: hypothetical protein MZU97_24830 [Bacillus subtilis]|nr:hypothetical protein [Bacillus subtilis]